MVDRGYIQAKLRAYEKELERAREVVKLWEGAVTALRGIVADMDRAEGSVDAAPPVGRQTEEGKDDAQGDQAG